jgi:hypothetical protein
MSRHFFAIYSGTLLKHSFTGVVRMIGKLISTGFSLATLPARLTFRSVRALAMTPAEASRLLADMRQASDQAVQELQGLLANVDADMTHKTAHLSTADKRLAAEPSQRNYTSVCSAISRASSTPIPRYLTVLSSFV